MANPATYDDVAARWRPLSTSEQGQATVFLNDAWRKLKREVSDLEARLDEAGEDSDLHDDAVMALANAVVRKMKNPDGLRQESVTVDDATRSRTLGNHGEPGELYFTDDELAALRLTTDTRDKAFSVMPAWDSDCDES